jgi:transcriptional regulator with XRE-family HTH domain
MDMPRRTHTTALTLAFGERMRSLRLELGISLGQLSEATAISKGHLSTIESGFASITIESILRIAIGLDLSPMLLLGFPEKDEYAAIFDLIRRLPTTRIKKLKKLLKQWVKEVEHAH